MKKMIVGAALCVATVTGLGAAPVMAGEITGNNTRPMVVGETPEGHMILNGRSECAFSGLNDEYIESDRDPMWDKVQNWGHIPKDMRDEGRKFFGPGVSCNPSKSQAAL